MDWQALQDQCERGQRELMEMDYLAAEATLAAAEKTAWENQDFDTLSRLYMPLQESRRQRRQHAGEGFVRLDLIATAADDAPEPRRVVETYRRGMLLVAGWGSITPAIAVRKLAAEQKLYLDTFLAAAYPVGGGTAVVIVPSGDVALPPAQDWSIDELVRRVPVGSIVLNRDELPQGARRGTAETYGQVMAMWERLHLPFLTAADETVDPIRKIEAYRRTIHVDYACELAHQKLSHIARELARTSRTPGRPA